VAVGGVGGGRAVGGANEVEETDGEGEEELIA
jgi:hypothetical protein